MSEVSFSFGGGSGASAGKRKSTKANKIQIRTNKKAKLNMNAFDSDPSHASSSADSSSGAGAASAIPVRADRSTTVSKVFGQVLDASLGQPRKLTLLDDEEEVPFEAVDQSEQDDATRPQTRTIIPLQEDAEEAEKQEQEEQEEQEEVDPLDAFMLDIQNTVHKEEEETKQRRTQKKHRNRSDPSIADELGVDDDDGGEDDDEEEEDMLESVARHLANEREKEALRAGLAVVEYDSDGNPVISENKVPVLPPLDHSLIDYAPFRRSFYQPVPEVAALTPLECAALRKRLDLSAEESEPSRPTGDPHTHGVPDSASALASAAPAGVASDAEVPCPCWSFDQMGFGHLLRTAIAAEQYTEPTPIQQQSVPVILSGRDMIGIAQTGSGKTAAFILPMVVHIMDQPRLRPGEGPIGLICVPTRELATQIYKEARKFCRGYKLRCAAVYGGGAKYEQVKKLKEGCDIVIGTPGRLIDMIKAKALKTTRTTFFVLDEADRMFHLGFEPQVTSIVGQLRTDRQTVLFSATFQKKVEKLARSALTRPIRVTVGVGGGSNADVSQVIHVMPLEEKWNWLVHHLPVMERAGSVLIFVKTKAAADELSGNLNKAKFMTASLHGALGQNDRTRVMFGFKHQTFRTLVATDLAARGLDVRSIRTVINFDAARTVDEHVHRIGRTGRGGDQGVAHTLLLPTQSKQAAQLLTHLRRSKQFVPDCLLELARRDPHFRGDDLAQRGSSSSSSSSSSAAFPSSSSSRSSLHPKENRGAGLGFREERGTSSSSSSSSSVARGHRAVGTHRYQQSESDFRQQFVRE